MYKKTTLLLSSLALFSVAYGGEADSSKKAVVPAQENQWVFALSVPGWAAGLSGDTGVGENLSYINVSPKKLMQSYDMVGTFRAEANKGRFGIMSDFIYLSLSDGIGTNTMVKKVDIRVDQTLGQLALSWRLIDSPRGSLDIYGGVRYTSLYERATFQANSKVIEEKSAALVDALGDQLKSALGSSTLSKQIEAGLKPGINPLVDHVSNLPAAPLGGNIRDAIRDRITQIFGERQDELVAAIRAKNEAKTAVLRQQAQNQIDNIKKDLSKKIARTLESKLHQTASLNYWWLDPFIGLRGRYNLNQAWYLTARGDVGGFGIGAKFAWEAEAALGCQLSKSVFAELGYRALGFDYKNNGITNDTITHGAQLTMGLNF